jgi:hypothetical protein
VPYKTIWVPAEVFLKYNGVTVYHAYSENNFDDRLFHWFTTNPDPDAEPNGDPYEFDVRTLETPAAEPPQQVVDALTPPSTELEKMTLKIRKAIDAGTIQSPRPDR